jgi:glycosyltransferase involved in cell wall biosynthesis
MKLLITTQAVDRNDSILGFFHGWITELATHFDYIEVVCLREGEHTLPSNVRVHTLGKEKRITSSLVYALRFLSHVWKLRRSYDAVFVHMNPEYVILGGLLWKLQGKKIHLWYNHPETGVRLWLAIALADKVFHTSPYAATAHAKNAVRMPAGIDTTLFTPQNVTRAPNSIYLQGRVAPSKRTHLACAAARLLRERGMPVTLTVVGPEDPSYAGRLKEEYADLIEAGALTFLGPKPNRETPALYSAHEVSLNLAADGHYDKTVLESLACGTPAVVASRAFSKVVPDEWAGHDTSEKLADAVARYFALPHEKHKVLSKEGREAVVSKESLAALGTALTLALRVV